MNNKALFILKKRQDTNSWGEYGCSKKSSGLLNSATFVKDMLNEAGLESKLVEVIDNNCIDREVTAFKPTVVIIEAFWVVPEKFEILYKLHPKVCWIIRNHSNWPFASNEGNLIDWSLKYLSYPNVFVSCNKKETAESFRDLVRIVYPKFTEFEVVYRTPFLPNYYPISNNPPSGEWHPNDEIHIGNFGAIRPLKNNLIQAIAAVKFADDIQKKLIYYINGHRIEGKAEPVVKSIVTLFDNHLPKAKLVNVGWKSHDVFLQLAANMDIMMQVTFDETFNIVLADGVNVNTLVLGSKEIPWLTDNSISDCTNVNEIVKGLHRISNPTLFKKLFGKSNKKSLKKYCDQTRKQWLTILGD